MKKKIAALTLVAGAAVAAYAAYGFGAESGLGKGERIVPFHPKHVVGALANTENCFPCTFQNRPQVQVWVNGDKTENVSAIAKSLEAQMVKNSDFKALIVMIAPADDQKALKAKIADMAKADGLKHVSVAMIDPKNDALGHYKINTSKDVKNTVFVYKNWKVENTLVNVKADKAGLTALNDAIGNVVK